MFDGAGYEPERDNVRLLSQHERVRDLMLDGEWRGLEEIAGLTGDPAASVSAQLRHLRKARFGGYVVTRRYRGEGLYEYQVRKPDPVDSGMGWLFADMEKEG